MILISPLLMALSQLDLTRWGSGNPSIALFDNFCYGPFEDYFLIGPLRTKLAWTWQWSSLSLYGLVAIGLPMDKISYVFYVETFLVLDIHFCLCTFESCGLWILLNAFWELFVTTHVWACILELFWDSTHAWACIFFGTLHMFGHISSYW